MDKKSRTIKVMETSNYAQFKTLLGNRDIKDNRVEKIKASIEKVGYIFNPILVNEKMEVIDGQGRLEALKQLDMPVHYIVQEGLGIEQCREMNIHQTNWNDYDYIKSHATRGNENYARLQSLIDAHKSLPVEVVYKSISDKLTDKAIPGFTKKLREGKITLTEDKARKCTWELRYAEGLQEVAKYIGGPATPFYTAILFAYREMDIDGHNNLQEIIKKHRLEFEGYNKAELYLKAFDEFYNKKYKKKRPELAINWMIANR